MIPFDPVAVESQRVLSLINHSGLAHWAAHGRFPVHFGAWRLMAAKMLDRHANGVRPVRFTKAESSSLFRRTNAQLIHSRNAFGVGFPRSLRRNFVAAEPSYNLQLKAWPFCLLAFSFHQRCMNKVYTNII